MVAEKVKIMIVADRLDMDKRERRKIKGDTTVWGLSN